MDDDLSAWDARHEQASYRLEIQGIDPDDPDPDDLDDPDEDPSLTAAERNPSLCRR